MGQIAHDDHVVNFELIKMARQAAFRGAAVKNAFVPGGDGGGAGAMDPLAMMGGGGMPPGGMPPGGEPAPPPQGGGGGGGGQDWSSLMPMITQAVQNVMGQQGGMGGAGGMNKALQPKVDEKVVLTQILKMLARIADALNVHIPASEQVVNQADLQQLAAATQQGTPMPGMDPAAAGGGGGAPAGAIPPMEGMQPAGVPGMGGEKMGAAKNGARANGQAFDSSGLTAVSNRAAAIAAQRRLRG